MKRKKYVYWQDGNMWLGYLEKNQITRLRKNQQKN